MKVLLIYRNKKLGYSIGKVFNSIESELKSTCDVESIYLPSIDYSPISIIKNIIYVYKYLKKGTFDIVHITGTEHYLLPFLYRCNTVLTIHDLGFYTNQKLSIRKLYKFFLWIYTIKYAKKVTFISDKSKNETLGTIELKTHNCHTILNPVDNSYIYNHKTLNKNCPTILHVGTKANKNLNNTILAIKDLNCKLRIIGELTSEQKLLLNIYKIRYSNTFNLSDSDILNEYINCDIVNFPSFYEGFGMPIIEGESIGRPVITSNISPMREIANNKTILVNPSDIKSIKNAYIKTLQNYEEVIEEGLKNVQRFNIKDITNQYLCIYKNLI